MSYSSEVLADSPLAYYRLGDTSGTTATDTSGNNRHGTYLNSPTFNVTGALTADSDKAVTFNNSNQRVTVAYGSWMDVTVVTLEAWVKTTATAGTIVSRLETSTPYRLGVTSGKAFMEARTLPPASGTNTLLQSTTSVNNGAWHHIVGTYDGSTMRIYVDGVQENSVAKTGAFFATSGGLAINSRNNDSYLGASIDEVAVYGTVLSGTRIAAHYTAGTTAGATTVNGGLVQEANTVLSGSVTVNQVVQGGLVTETTTVLTPFVTEGIIRYGGLITETTSVLPGVTSAGALVEGGLISESTTVLAGSTIDGEQINGGLVTEASTVLPGTVILGYATTSRDITSGRIRYGVGYATWLPAVVETPPHLGGVGGGAGGGSAAAARDVAFAFGDVTIVGTQPTFTTETASEPRGRDRIIVGGKDVTYFRGAEVRVGQYQLMEPFGYGTATLEFPQVYPEYEAIGEGDLSWLAPESKVLIQRVDAAGNVIATDYRGYLIAPNANTGTFTYEVGGEVTGPAALRWRPMPLFRTVEDIGRQMARVLGFVGVRTPRLGPDTGIEIARVGGMTLLEYMQQLVGRAWTRDGNQWTVMPDDQGVYRTARKDRTTIAGAVYLSASSAEADLRRDIAEEPNRIFATGVTPAGKRVRFGRYPGLDISGNPPAFPGNLSAGDTGDGVLALIRQLQVQGYLNAETAPGQYDADVTKAIREVQDDADLTVTGNVDAATWDAIFDNTSQGVSLKLARIEPAAQKRYTKQYRYSASGAIKGRNPFYDPTRLKIDRSIDFGTGFTQEQMREWSKAELVEASDPNWVGSLTIHSGAIVAGDHTPGDPIGAVLPARDIRPGMNLSLPQFQGGIVAHVTACRVAGDVVTLDVDTRARDAWNVAQVIERNRESRRDPARAFFRELASSKAQKDAIEEWSEVGGIIPDQTLTAGWNVFETVGGQSGTVRWLRYSTNPNAESCVAVFGKKVWPKALDRLIGNPLTEEGSARWAQASIKRQLERDHAILHAAGDATDPGGYSPGHKSKGNPFTGDVEDDSTFPYHTDHRPILFVAVYVDRDCTIPGGRIMWPQLESGA